MLPPPGHWITKSRPDARRSTAAASPAQKKNQPGRELLRAFGALPHELSFPARRGSSDTQGQVVARELDDRPFLIRVIPIRERAALHMKSEGCTRRIGRIRAEMSQRPRGYALVLLGCSLKSSGCEFNTRSAREL